MNAFRTTEQWSEKTPQEELGGGIVDPNRPDETLDITVVNRTRKSSHTKKRKTNRSGGRGGVQPSDSDLDPNWTVTGRQPYSQETARINHEGNMLAKAGARAYKLARNLPDTGFAYPGGVDKNRRNALLWAASLLSEAAQADGASNVMREPEHEAYPEVSRYYRDAEQAAELADTRRVMSEKLIASACSKCYFYEDCMYKNRPEKLVEDIRDRDVRRKYVEQIGGPEVQPHEFVSCESAVRKATAVNTGPGELID